MPELSAFQLDALIRTLAGGSQRAQCLCRSMGITATCRACGGTGWQYIELKPGAKASAQQWLGEQPAAYQATIKKLVSQVKLSKAEKLPKVESVLPETGPSIP